MNRILTYEPFKNRTGFQINEINIKHIMSHQFKLIEDMEMTGDAPKDFLRINDCEGHAKNPGAQWPYYIVKLGHKWYPNESITEQLITDIGKSLDIKVADSNLFMIEGMVRFGSKYFLQKKESLYHGAEILSAYLDEPDEEWIEFLEKEKTIKEYLNIDIVKKSILNSFGKIEGSAIFKDLIQMLLFDCFVGNNDRHYFNWGVIIHLEGKTTPYFSPIYDTARGLWWNASEEKIRSVFQDQDQNSSEIESYVIGSKPKISTPDNFNCNHFELIRYIKENNDLEKFHIDFWTDVNILTPIYNLIDQKFRYLMSNERRTVIKTTLELRHQKLKEVLQS